MESLEEEAKEEMKQAGQRLMKLISEKAAYNILDVAVTFDDTWAKRGFTSLTGVVFVKSIDTGKFWTIMFFPKFARNVP